jgi:hypothetical protein
MLKKCKCSLTLMNIVKKFHIIRLDSEKKCNLIRIVCNIYVCMLRLPKYIISSYIFNMISLVLPFPLKKPADIKHYEFFIYHYIN